MPQPSHCRLRKTYSDASCFEPERPPSLAGTVHTFVVWNPVFNTSANAPDASQPSANGRLVVAGAKSANPCVQAYAVYAQGHQLERAGD